MKTITILTPAASLPTIAYLPNRLGTGEIVATTVYREGDWYEMPHPTDAGRRCKVDPAVTLPVTPDGALAAARQRGGGSGAVVMRAAS